MKPWWPKAMVAGGAVAMVMACAARKDTKSNGLQDHFGTAMNYPHFHSVKEFLHDFEVVAGICCGRFQGKKLHLFRISPGFREKVCLTVTLADHCVV